MTGSLNRLFVAAGCSTQVELAAYLGIRQASVASAKIKGAIPPNWLLMLLRRTGTNPDWILTGKGPRYLHACKEARHLYAETIGHLEKWTTEELLAEVLRRSMRGFSQ